MKIRNLLLPFLLLGTVLSIPSTISKTEALFTNNNVVTEDFNKKALDSTKWKLNDTLFNVDHYSMRFNPQTYLWGSLLIQQSVELKDSYIIEFDSKSMNNPNSGGWLGVALGLKNKNTTFADAPFAFVFYPSYSSGANGTYCDMKQRGYLETYPNINLYTTPFYKYGLETRTRIYVDIINENLSKVYFDILDTDGNIVKEHGEQDIFTVDQALTGYFGFNNSGVNMEMSKFSLINKSDNRILYYDDFTESSIQYLTEGVGAWKTTSFTTDDLVLGPVGNAKLNSNKSSIVYLEQINNSNFENVDAAYTGSVNIEYFSMSFNSLAGFEFGKETVDSRGIVAGVQKSRFGYSLIAIDENGNELAKAICPYSAAGLVVDLSFEYRNNGTFVVYTEDITIEFKSSKINGYIGLANISLDGNEASGPFVDNFVLNRMIEDTNYSPDVSINFDGTKDVTIGYATFKDYYVSSKEWRMTKNNQLALNYYDETNPNGYMCFSGATEQTTFGTINKYNDFVCKFDVEILTDVDDLEEGAGFGLEFGVQSSSALFDNIQSLGIYNTNFLSPKASIIEPKHCSIQESESGGSLSFLKPGGSESEFIQFFEKRNNSAPKFNVMYVVLDGVVSLYFKYDDEPESVLNTPRATALAERSTNGFVNVVGKGNITFNLDNFSVTNLDFINRNDDYLSYKDTNYQIRTRKDFSVATNTNGLVLTNAALKNKALRLNHDGMMSTVSKTGNGIYRIGFKQIEEKAILKFGDASFALADYENEKCLIASDAQTTNTINLGKEFNFSNSYIEILKTGDLFRYRLISGESKLSAIIKEWSSFTLNNGNDYNNFKVISVGITDISSFTFINFDSHETIKARDFDPVNDVFVAWEVKTSIQEIEAKNKEGCQSSLLSSTFIISFVLLTACVVLILRRFKHE